MGIVPAGERQRESVLQTVATNLEAWTVQVKREKAIYHTLNKCSVDVTRKVLVAEAWCPVSGIPRVQQALQEVSHHTSGSVSTPTSRTLPDPMMKWAVTRVVLLAGHLCRLALC